MQNTVEVSKSPQEDKLDIGKILSKLIDKWPVFLISIILCILIAYLYAKYSSPIYQVHAKLLVNDEKSSGLNKQANSLMDLGGIMGASSSVENEMEVLKTRFLMEQVVRELELNIVYSQKQNLKYREIYQSPIKLNILKGVDTIQTASFLVEFVSKNEIKISNEVFSKVTTWNSSFNIPKVGIVSVEKISQNSNDFVKPVTVEVYSIDERVSSLMNRLSVSLSNKLGSVIDLGFAYSVPRKGEDILNTLIKRYRSFNLDDKNKIADSTSKFIRNRLSIIAGELGDVENSVQNFKQTNKLADMSEQGKLLVQNSGEFGSELAKAETQVSILTDLERYLKDEQKNKRVFPTSLLPSDMVFSNLMAEYNSLLIERERQLLSLTEENPIVSNIDVQISSLRRGILANIQSTKNTYILTRDKLKSQLNQAEGQILGVPKIEKDYLKLARNQQIKQELYIFLMQKAEETAISKSSNIAIAKTIDPPKADNNPISPKKNIIYLSGIIIGLIFPLVLLFLIDILNTTIGTREDITNQTKVPIIGEISHNSSNDNLVVANKGRSAISEQFRALRTNLSFYLRNENEKVILLTSSMSGEGKSFTAINLANILALAGKKVLLMELDLRKPGLSSKLDISNDIGFSNYSIDNTLNFSDIVKPLTLNPNMFIVTSGPLPPNPAETLISERIPHLISELKANFDYILMDAPPIGIIADAQLLARYADAILYIVRQKITQKNQISILEDLHTSEKMKNLGVVVNDIVTKYYGYGYGYGTYGAEESPSSWIDKIKSKFKK